MNWKKLTAVEQLDQLVTASAQNPVLIFKHSTRCSISATSLSRLERNWEDIGTVPYYLDIIAHRDVSNALADRFGVPHQSPQVLVLKNGDCIHDSSHFSIAFDAIKDVVVQQA